MTVRRGERSWQARVRSASVFRSDICRLRTHLPGAASALSRMRSTGSPSARPLLRPSFEGPPRAIKLAWNATAICTSAAPVAKERGFFARHNLDVEFVNFGGSTEQLLEAIATGKADAGIGMALRWLKPLEQGFDVRITAGIHGGCMRLLGSKAAGIDSLESLKGKTVAISDQASPTKNFFSIFLLKQGIAPESIQWRQYPANSALPGGRERRGACARRCRSFDVPLAQGRKAERSCNESSAEVREPDLLRVAIRGGLVRDEKPVATALTRAVLEAGDHVGHDPADRPPCFLRTAAKVL